MSKYGHKVVPDKAPEPSLVQLNAQILVRQG